MHFHWDRQCNPSSNITDVFGTGKILHGSADLNRAVTGPCRPELYAISKGSSTKLSDPHNTALIKTLKSTDLMYLL